MRRAGWGSVLTAIGTLAYYVAYAYIVWRTLHGDFTIGDLTFLAGSFRRLRNLLESLLLGFSQVAGQALYLDDLFSFFEIEPEIVQPPNPRPFPIPIQRGFAFENVGFRYPGAERWAVRNLTFELHAGEILALVGENGAGKTTLVKLLARLYDPDEGRILLDGHDLREYDLFALRPISVIFQDFVRYYFSAADNIAVGASSTWRSRAHRRGRRAQPGRRSHAKLPQGYKQVLGKRFRTGLICQAVSGRRSPSHAPICAMRSCDLDEPTAALDARASTGVRAVQGSPRQDRRADLAPLFQRAHGRSHRRAGRRPRRGRRRARAGATGRALAACSNCRRRGIGSDRAAKANAMLGIRAAAVQRKPSDEPAPDAVLDKASRRDGRLR
jgi:ATP-binding cassette subfamily B protein